MHGIFDSEVLILELNQAPIQANSIVRCGGYQKHGVHIKNSKIEIANYDANFAPILYLTGPGNYTIEDNYLKNFQQPSPRGILEALNSNGCALAGSHSYIFTRNLWEGRLDQPASGSMFFKNSENLDVPGEWTLLFTQNTFRNVLFKTQWFQIESIKPWKRFDISDNVFENIDYPVPSYLFLIKSPGSLLTLNNNSFLNCKMD